MNITITVAKMADTSIQFFNVEAEPDEEFFALPVEQRQNIVADAINALQFLQIDMERESAGLSE
jgi:hypothetical protein